MAFWSDTNRNHNSYLVTSCDKCPYLKTNFNYDFRCLALTCGKTGRILIRPDDYIDSECPFDKEGSNEIREGAAHQ